MKLLGLGLIAFCISANAAEPLTDFEAIVMRCKGAFDALPPSDVVKHPDTNLWVKRVWGPRTVTYDVQKTDSLVSPFLAKMEIAQLVATKNTSDEARTRALEISLEKEGNRIFYQLNFAYQKGLWELVDGKSGLALGSSGGRAEPLLTLSRANLLKYQWPLQNCLPLQ